MQVLAASGIEIYNADFEQGNNALHYCAMDADRYAILKMLVSSNYEVNIANKLGDTATHKAA